LRGVVVRHESILVTDSCSKGALDDKVVGGEKNGTIGVTMDGGERCKTEVNDAVETQLMNL
jgi:hypothetical protein